LQRAFFLDVLPAQPAATDFAGRTESGNARPSGAAAYSRCPEPSGEAQQSGKGHHFTIDQRALVGAGREHLHAAIVYGECVAGEDRGKAAPRRRIGCLDPGNLPK